MSEYFTKFLDTSDFPARWRCGNWSEFLGWLHIISDVATFVAYFTIPAVLVYFVRKRDDFPFHKLFWLFGGFIFACGTVHLIEAIIFWHPIYRVSGLMKFFTAFISWITVFALIRYTPRILHLPSMAAANERLTLEMDQRMKTEQRLKESEAMALAASRSKSEFLANMSHEIRTPMAAILGYADVLLGHLKDPDNRNCVLVMKRNGQHLLSLINDILDLSRIEAGKLEIDVERVSLAQLVSELQSLMHVRADEKNLEFHAEFSSRVPEEIETDPTRLRQVLINLIGNAMKFTERGSVLLSVAYVRREDLPIEKYQPLLTRSSTELDLPTTGYLQFEVRDTGIGMSPAQQERLFKPFSQGDSSVTRTYGGSGLGLAISKRLTEMLGGTISLESELGVGSTFTLRLPLASIDDSQLVKPDLQHRALAVAEEKAKPENLRCRVLVVDDRRDVRHISQHFLEKAGATVATVEDGQQAIDASLAAREAGEPFAVIVMDMQMPNVDGLQAVAELRSAGIDWPIIALTADAMKGDRDKCLSGGCDDYLSKPIDQAKLVSMVAKYTKHISSQELQQLRIERLQALRATLSVETQPPQEVSDE